MTGRALLLLWLIPVVAIAVGCGDSSPSDAGAEAGVDSGRDGGLDAGPTDGGPRCDSSCAVGTACCNGSGGPAMCIDVLADPVNCGECGRRCEDGFGTTCQEGSCVCGLAIRGCGGVRRSFCCPPGDGGTYHCANLDEDGADCGECNAACDAAQSDRCAGGRCTCGEGRTACAGTPEDTCCMDLFATVGCVDTTTDRMHCGRCNNICMGLEECIGGTCTRGAECPGGCTEGFICCRGECCSRTTCDRETCGPPSDAGVADGGG